MTREFTCIICPNGCEISADYEIQADQSVVIHSLEGATCKRGAEYVKQELTDPEIYCRWSHDSESIGRRS